MRIRFTATDDLNDCVAKMLRSCRVHSDETLAEVADRVGVTPQTVHNCEHGRGSVKTAWRIVQSFGKADVELSIELGA